MNDCTYISLFNFAQLDNRFIVMASNCCEFVFNSDMDNREEDGKWIMMYF